MTNRLILALPVLAAAITTAFAQSRPAAGPATTPATAPSGRLFMVRQDGLYGFIDAAGTVVIKPRFTMGNAPVSSIDNFSDGMARVMVEVNKWGYIDRTGKFAIEPQYEYAERFAEGLAPFRDSQTRKYGYIDKAGKVVISPQFDCAWPFSEGLAMYQVARDPDEKQNKFGFIDRKGNIVIKPFPCDDPGYYFHEGMFRFRKGELHGFMDKAGAFVIEPAFKVAGQFCEGVAMAGKEYGKAGFIDKAGKWVIEPKFRAVTDFSEGMAGCSEGAFKWGFIDKKGEVAVKPQWVSVGKFKEGLASIRVDPPENIFKETRGTISAEIKSPPKFGFIDPTGKTVIPAQYDEVEPFDGGLARVQIDKKHGYIDHKGNLIWPPSD